MLYRNIALTGASSGLGRALALELAAPGVTLHLSGRDAARLGTVAAEVRARGASTTETLLDVTNRDGMEAWVRNIPGLDLTIANAGISAGPGDGAFESSGQIRAVFATNVDGVFNTVLPALERRCRHIAIIGSIAGLIALPSSPAYSAAKAALDFWVRATAPRAAREGITLTIVRPGFIRTPLTEKNPYTMPGLMDSGQAAKIIAAGIARGQQSITFPLWLAALAWFGNLMPKRLFSALPGKPPQG
jgi:NAD(P)-dependent dehydrogenase (short-subunit alcohol dehydrogenase family)